VLVVSCQQTTDDRRPTIDDRRPTTDKVKQYKTLATLADLGVLAVKKG